MIPISCVLLAGGKSSRLGRDKQKEIVGGMRVVDREISVLAQLSDDIVMVGDTLFRQAELGIVGGIRCVTDIYPGYGSLGGLFSGLSHCKYDWAVVVAGDMPFLNQRLFEDLSSKISDDIDAVVPKFEGRMQTTHALYSKNCLPHIGDSIRNGNLRMNSYFDSIGLQIVELDNVMPKIINSFLNINTEDDLKEARHIALVNQCL